MHREIEILSIFPIFIYLSLTEDSPLSSDMSVQDLDNLFDLHKRIGNLEDNVEVIHIGQFLKSLETTG